MFIACTEKCIYQKDGLCVKNDCGMKNEYISGSVSCPHFTTKESNNVMDSSNRPAASKDHKHFVRV